MSSRDLENSSRTQHASERLLFLLKTRGPQTASNLGLLLGTTGEAARQQLVKLAAEGLVEPHAEPVGVGRPQQIWHLTTKANGRFPDTHAELTAQLIKTIRAQLGEEALAAVIELRAKEVNSAYQVELADKESLEEKVAGLVEIRSREGYMAEWKAENGAYYLIENHCPICIAASACQGFCKSELSAFQTAIGALGAVERTEHILSGSRRCSYKISPKASAKNGPAR